MTYKNYIVTTFKTVLSAIFYVYKIIFVGVKLYYNNFINVIYPETVVYNLVKKNSKFLKFFSDEKQMDPDNNKFHFNICVKQHIKLTLTKNS